MAKSICSLEAVEVVASVASTAKKVIDIVSGRILNPSLFSCLIYLSDKRVNRQRIQTKRQDAELGTPKPRLKNDLRK